jgi:glycosyltransferase involved in cell wall biosynthesis
MGLKILQICNKPPFPPIEGGPIAMNAITQALIEQGHTVTVFAVNSTKFDVKKIPQDYIDKTSYTEVQIDLSIKHFQAFKNLFTNQSLHVERYKTKAFYDALLSVLKSKKFDIIHFESVFLAFSIPFIKQHTDAKIFIRTHNVEHMIWQRLQVNEKNILKKWYLKHIANTLKMYELGMFDKVDGVLAITKQDADLFKSLGVSVPISVLPFGVDVASVRPYIQEIKRAKPSVFFIGSMNWQPNMEGVLWFLKEVWNHPDYDFSAYELHIAGRHTPDSLYAYANENTFIHGELEDAYSFMTNHDVMIVPLWSGSGVRIKIVEAFMMKKAVVASSIGAEGLQYTSGKDVLIANDSKTFADSIHYLLQNLEIAKEMGERAYDLILNYHNNRLIISELVKKYKEA